MDNTYALNEIVQSRLKEGKVTYVDVKTAYDSVLYDGLWLKLWKMGVRGKVWRVIKQISRSVVLLEGKKSDTFSLEQGMLQECTLLFFIFINNLLIEVEKAGL